MAKEKTERCFTDLVSEERIQSALYVSVVRVPLGGRDDRCLGASCPFASSVSHT